MNELQFLTWVRGPGLDIAAACRVLPPGTPAEQVKILRTAMAKMYSDPEFHKDYKKLVGEEPTPILGEEMERGIKELPRDPELVDLFKKLNAAGPLPAR